MTSPKQLINDCNFEKLHHFWMGLAVKSCSFIDFYPKYQVPEVSQCNELHRFSANRKTSSD